MNSAIARTGSSILNEPGFKYRLYFWGESITGTPEQLQRIGIGIDIQFPERAGRWRRRCIDPRGLEVELAVSVCDVGLFHASINVPGYEVLDDGVVAKPFAPGVDLREERWNDEYTGTADALVSAGIVPAGYFPGWPGMNKTTVNICPDGTLERLSNKAKEAGGRYVVQKSKGQRPTYKVMVRLTWEIKEKRRQAYERRRDAWERRMRDLPRPAPLIDLPGFRSAPKVKLIPEYRVDGNVIHLAPRSEWRAESCQA